MEVIILSLCYCSFMIFSYRILVNWCKLANDKEITKFLVSWYKDNPICNHQNSQLYFSLLIISFGDYKISPNYLVYRGTRRSAWKCFAGSRAAKWMRFSSQAGPRTLKWSKYFRSQECCTLSHVSKNQSSFKLKNQNSLFS